MLIVVPNAHDYHSYIDALNGRSLFTINLNSFNSMLSPIGDTLKSLADRQVLNPFHFPIGGANTSPASAVVYHET